jgi:hypothetical protein
VFSNARRSDGTCDTTNVNASGNNYGFWILLMTDFSEVSLIRLSPPFAAQECINYSRSLTATILSIVTVVSYALDRIGKKARIRSNAARENQKRDPEGVLAKIHKKGRLFCRFW